MMSALVARSPIVLFQRIPEGWIKTAQASRRLPQIEIKNFGRNRKSVVVNLPAIFLDRALLLFTVEALAHR
jgi:hypothetical protein